MNKLKELDINKLLDIKQKSRCRWTLEGDENSSFFHGILKSNAKSNGIAGLNIDGVWRSNPDEIKSECLEFFESKLKEPLSSRPKFKSNKFQKLSSEDKEVLEQNFTADEIKSAVWKCGNDKAPDHDDFNFEFIKKFWHIIGYDFVEAVQFFGVHKKVTGGCNSSFITLVPKVGNPLCLADYRPINLI